MDAARKRRVRAVALSTAALLLAGALVYTSFSGATEAATPSQLARSAESGRSYQLTGKVVDGSVRREGERLRFEIRDRAGRTAIPVIYEGVVPDPFREGREVIVTGHVAGGTLVGERDSLVTKCPSKFTEKKKGVQSS
jgi:cytochrome c-type biogenesis protein CcmE